jgi:hypothetical protein
MTENELKDWKPVAPCDKAITQRALFEWTQYWGEVKVQKRLLEYLNQYAQSNPATFIPVQIKQMLKELETNHV